MPMVLVGRSVLVLLAVVIVSTLALQSSANLMIPRDTKEKVLITVGNWMGPMTVIYVQCSRNYYVDFLWWKVQQWEEYYVSYLFYRDISRLELRVNVTSAASPEQQYKCKLKVSKRHECEYLVLSSKDQDQLKRCSSAVGGCKWVVKPEGMYFKSSNGTERGRFVQPHCSKVDLNYLRSWNHA